MVIFSSESIAGFLLSVVQDEEETDLNLEALTEIPKNPKKDKKKSSVTHGWVTLTHSAAS